MSAADINTILIAEDNRDSRTMLCVFLQNHGYRVLEAENGAEAVRIAQEEIPDLILMDLHMPELDGIAAAKRIRNLRGLGDVPILANSADGKRGMEFFLSADELGTGFISYLTKPLNFKTLLEDIKMLLPVAA